MKGFGEQQSYYPYSYSCYYHPGEVVVGICAPCLKERLLVLASKQGHLIPMSSKEESQNHHHHHGIISFIRVPSCKKPSATAAGIPKVFALGSSFLLHRSHSHGHDKKAEESETSSIASLDDAFISIKFEDKGDQSSSWDEKKINRCDRKKPMINDCCAPCNINQQHLHLRARGNGSDRTVVEHAKRSHGGALRWRKRIGHLFQLVTRWKRPSKAGMCHVGPACKVEGVKGRKKGWIRRARPRGGPQVE